MTDKHKENTHTHIHTPTGGPSQLCRQHPTSLFLPPSSGTRSATRILESLADVSAWTTAHNLKLNLHKYELLFIPGKDCICMYLSVTVVDFKVSPSSTVKNLGVILDNRLSCAPICILQMLQRFSCRSWESSQE